MSTVGAGTTLGRLGAWREPGWGRGAWEGGARTAERATRCDRLQTVLRQSLNSWSTRELAT